MSEKKQIEEIRKDIFAAFGGYAKWEEDWQSLAEAVYNAGYRKQSEGTWEKSDIPGEKYVCSECGGACWYYDYEGDVAKSKFCPNCGAKMKGGRVKRELCGVGLRTSEYLNAQEYGKGEWELGRSGCMYYCSECKYAAHPREVDEWSHCPRCGAKMKGGAE